MQASNFIQADTLGTIEKWITEATSGYNDGWTQKHYRDQLQEIYDRLNGLSFILKDENGKENINK
jgi:hypothetical protein